MQIKVIYGMGLINIWLINANEIDLTRAQVWGLDKKIEINYFLYIVIHNGSIIRPEEWN